MSTESLEAWVLRYLRSYCPEGLTPSGEVSALFTAGVDFLKGPFPNAPINRLALLAWDVIQNGITPLCMGLPVVSLAFVFSRTSNNPQACIATPKSWVRMLRQDPLTQLGAIIFVCSQAVDYYYDRLSLDETKVRGRAYEADYLLTIQKMSPKWGLNSYQSQVLREFPEGLATPQANKALYCTHPFISA